MNILSKSVLFKSPEVLHDWMAQNLEYEEYTDDWLSKSPQRVLNTLCGNCIDQSYFEKFCLEKQGYKCRLYLVFEYINDPLEDSKQGHLFCVYKEYNTYCWFENAWQRFSGIRKYSSINNLLDDVYAKFCDTTATLPNVWIGRAGLAQYNIPYYPDWLEQSLAYFYEEKANKY